MSFCRSDQYGITDSSASDSSRANAPERLHASEAAVSIFVGPTSKEPPLFLQEYAMKGVPRCLEALAPSVWKTLASVMMNPRPLTRARNTCFLDPRILFSRDQR